jgi:peptide/nickel transport system permease protein
VDTARRTRGDISNAAASARRPKTKVDTSRNIRSRLYRRVAHDPVALAAVAVLAFVSGLALLAPLLPLADPNDVNVAVRFLPPGTPGYPIGTDEVGRDIMSRLILGGRVSLIVAIVPTVLALFIGAVLGLIAGFFGGLWDHLVMRGVDVLLAFPYILLAISIASFLGPGLFNAMFAISVLVVPVIARLIRSTALSLRSRDFVLAARAMGATTPRIITRHIVPNSVSILIIYGTLQTANMVGTAAALGFLGLGVAPPQAEWGAMLAAGRSALLIAPHVATIPGVVILGVALALNLLGEAFRDALDPRTVDPQA